MINENKFMISVIMSVHNSDQYLTETIESVLSQTISDFEFIIINDASSDSSQDIIEFFEDHDFRIKLINNKKNLGIGKSRNKGLSMARGEFIANMDSDDICYPDRLEKQLNYMKTNPDTLVLGGQIQPVDSEGVKLGSPYRVPHSIYRWDVLTTKLSIYHPCMMVKREYIQSIGGYPEDIENAVDRGLFIRMALNTRFNMFNLSDVLVKYRIHSQSTSNARKNLQLENSRQMRKQAVEKILQRHISDDEFRALFEKNPGEITSELAAKIYPIYAEFFRNYKKQYNLNKDELSHSKKIFLKKILSGMSKYKVRDIQLLTYLLLDNPNIFLKIAINKIFRSNCKW